jgi:4-amino-4-deoxy-L-arabinose transferase-like glycosyltransferase
VWGAVIMTVAPEDSHRHVLRDYPGVILPSRDLPGYTIDIWNIYDTRHYVTIAQYGYEADPDYLTAFFPGYPLLIRLVSIPLFGHSLLAAIMVANISALMFFWYFYRLVEADYGEIIAKRAVILSAVFPTSFFLFLGYTEPPLMAFMAAAFYYGRQHKWWLAGVLAGCAALTKQSGVFLTLPLAYMYWRQYITYKDRWSFFKRREWFALFLCPLAALVYTVYRYLYLLHPNVYHATDLGAGEILTFPGVPLLNAINQVNFDNPLLAANIMEIGFTVLMIGLVAGAILKIRSTTYSLYSCMLAVVTLGVTWPNVYRPEADIPRRMLIIFPIFIYLALVTPNRRVFRYLVYTSSALFLVLSGLFVNWIFIS